MVRRRSNLARLAPYRAFLTMAVAVSAISVASMATAADPGLNKMCPVMSFEEADPAITIQYLGRTVAFCCDTCEKKFLANPERYVGRLAAFSDEGEDRAGQDHDSGGGASGSGHAHSSDETKMPLIARIHPVVVHFPLAGVPIAMVAMLAWLVSRKKLFAYGDVPPIALAAVSSVFAVVTGNFAHDSMRFSDAMHDYVEWHQFAATALMILVLMLTGLRLWRWRRLNGGWLVAYAGGLVVATGLVGVVGYLGGSLVFGPDHLAW